MKTQFYDQVLIVDDDPIFRLMLQKFLHKEGFSVTQAASGEEALNCFRSRPTSIVLMDANMPGMSGFTCCEQLRELPDGKEAAVLMLTALDDGSFVDQAFAAGAMDYLTKPVHWAVLRNRLHYLRQIRRSQQAQRISEARKSAILQSALDSIMTVALDGIIQEMNPAACKAFGYPDGESATGQLISKLVPSLHVLCSTSEPQEILLNGRQEAVAVRRDSSQFPIEMTLGHTEVEGGFYTLILRDITARKQVEQERKLAATILESTADAVIITDMENRINSVNPAFSRITGYREEDVLGKTPAVFKSGRHDRDFYRELWATLRSKGHWQGEIWNRRKSGEVYPQWLSINRVIDNRSGDLSCHVAMFSDISVRKKNEQKIWHQAHHDSLTQLPNRSYFLTHLSNTMEAAKTSGNMMALMFIDLDHFKAVNDTLGHSKGDQLLIEAAERLSSCVRDKDIVARLGGDEFTAILPEIGSREAAREIGQRILAEIIQPFYLSTLQPSHISASIGITFFPQDANDIESLLTQADKAMYTAKENGRNQFVCFDAITETDLT